MISATEHDPGSKLRIAWPKDSQVTPVFSRCKRYRYELREIWDSSRPLVLWVMMNPSVACLEFSDRTLQKTGKFSRAWGFGGQLIGNVHAYRATDKKRLLEVDDPIGPKNDSSLVQMASEAEIVVLGFGHPPKPLRQRGGKVVALLKHHPRVCYLRLSKDGTPAHPLFLPPSLTPLPFPAKP